MTLPRIHRPRRIGFGSTLAARFAAGCFLILVSRGTVLADDGGPDAAPSNCGKCDQTIPMPSVAPVPIEACRHAGVLILSAGAIAFAAAVLLHRRTRKASEEERRRYVRRTLGSYVTMCLWDNVDQLRRKSRKGTAHAMLTRVQDCLEENKTLGLADLKVIIPEVEALPKSHHKEQLLRLLKDRESIASSTVRSMTGG